MTTAADASVAKMRNSEETMELTIGFMGVIRAATAVHPIQKDRLAGVSGNFRKISGSPRGTMEIPMVSFIQIPAQNPAILRKHQLPKDFPTMKRAEFPPRRAVPETHRAIAG